MGVKEKLIELFENNRGEYLSGEELAARLGCTRGAVWKAVGALRQEGYRLDALPNKGYMLMDETDVLSEAGVRKYLSSPEGIELKVFKRVDSTNNIIRDLANSGAAEGAAAIAGEQTAGRGRMGRSFFSPSDTGLYLSILLRPQLTAPEAVRITTAAAVAVAEAAEAVSGERAEIKWVNDVYMRGKKICGILTEAAFSLETGGLDYAVVGIGVNAYEPEGGFPEEIRDIAGPVLKERCPDMRNRLAAEILGRFMGYYRALSQNTFLDGYRSRLMWQGERINVINPSGSYPCTALGVDEECRLRVRLDDGSESLVNSGEISIRKV
ncbi:MAG: biotin--[Ruminococcus sp.]|nr:biotin--[acetyl-CoA-carboxylase] ligase [Ruminococcus sp.]